MSVRGRIVGAVAGAAGVAVAGAAYGVVRQRHRISQRPGEPIPLGELRSAPLTVVADDGVPLTRGGIVIAPGHGHMLVRGGGGQLTTALSYAPARSGCTPSVDPMFASLAEATDGHVAGVLLSGMGRDGTDGAQAIVDAGGSIYAQDAESCAVWGMPRAVTETGLAVAALPPEDLARALAEQVGAA